MASLPQKTWPLNVHVCWSRVMQFLGYILIISASGLASEPETQSETGEIMVKVFDTLSKYFEDICPSTWFLKLLNSFNLEVIEMDGSIMIFGQNGFLGLNFFTFPGEGGQQYVTMEIMWSSGWAGILRLIIRIGRPFANDHPDGLAICKCSSGFLPCNQILLYLFLFSANFLFSSNKLIFSFNTFLRL